MFQNLIFKASFKCDDDEQHIQVKILIKWYEVQPLVLRQTNLGIQWKAVLVKSKFLISKYAFFKYGVKKTTLVFLFFYP